MDFWEIGKCELLYARNNLIMWQVERNHKGSKYQSVVIIWLCVFIWIIPKQIIDGVRFHADNHKKYIEELIY